MVDRAVEEREEHAQQDVDGQDAEHRLNRHGLLAPQAPQDPDHDRRRGEPDQQRVGQVRRSAVDVAGCDFGGADQDQCRRDDGRDAA